MRGNKNVTIRLSKDNYNRPTPLYAKEGSFIKISGMKRLGMIVTGASWAFGATQLTCKSGYKPAPRSRLHNRTKFSKIKHRIL